MSDTELHTYYATCPGGHFQIADAPNRDAALAVLTQLFGYEAANKWLITETEPDSRRLGDYNWLEEANESWLADNGWPELITHLSRIPDQDAPIMIRTYLSGLGQSDLDPVGYVQRIDGAYVIELEDPWGYEPKPQHHHFTARP